jgi:hypothetical protein
MAFVLKKSATYEWPVVLRLPIDGGRHEKQTFDARFNRLAQTRINEIQDLFRAKQRGDDEIDLTDQSVADEVLAGWSNVQDEDGEDVPFTAASKAELLNIPAVASAIVVAYFESVTGNKAKN